MFWNFSRKFFGYKNLLYGKLSQRLNIFLLESCLLYSVAKSFTLFRKSDGGFHWNGLTIYVLTNKIKNSAQLKDRELRLLVLLLLIILEMSSSAVLECAACIFFFFRKVWVFWEKIHSNFVKSWEMKNLPWDSDKGSETVWYAVKPGELGGLFNYSAVWLRYKIS